MRIPRWTTYPAVAVLLTAAFLAVPKGTKHPEKGAASAAREAVAGLSAENRLGATLQLVDFLPRDHVTDGSLDYREAVQAALDAAARGTLELPDFPVRCDGAPGASYCLIVRSATRVTGSPGSVLLTESPATQLLRAEGVAYLVLEGFGVRGVGQGGTQLGHGLVQVTGGEQVRIKGLTVTGADSDGIVLSQVENCSVEGCLVERTSKVGIYLNACSNGIVRGNIIRQFGGHVVAGNNPVGAGIQLSSNQNVVCSENVIGQGRGVGILCNAYSGGDKPWGNTLRGNRIESVSNPRNLSVSSGIRLANGSSDKGTGTLVTGNSIWNCGAYGIYAENHGGSAILGNLVVASDRTGIVISTIRDLQLLDNVVLNSDTSGTGAQAAILLINDADGVTSEGNVLKNTALHGEAIGAEEVRDLSGGSSNSLEPRILHAAGSPRSGSWGQGDLVYNSAPVSGGNLGWVCTVAGKPGVWASFGKIE